MSDALRPAPALVNVQHACGCTWRWHWFKSGADIIAAAGLAAALNCPRCDGTLTGPGDVSYLPSGVCHAHEGDCPENPHESLMDALGVRFRHGRLILL